MTKHTQVIAAVTAAITAGTIPAVFTREQATALCPSILPVTVHTILNDESNATYAKAIERGKVSLTRLGQGRYSLATPVTVASPVVTVSAVSRIREMLAAKSAAASLAGNVARVRALAESLKDDDARDAILTALDESPTSFAELETLCAELAQ